MIEGLNFDMSEELFLDRPARFIGERYDFVHYGAVGIKFNYKE